MASHGDKDRSASFRASGKRDFEKKIGRDDNLRVTYIGARLASHEGNFSETWI